MAIIKKIGYYSSTGIATMSEIQYRPIIEIFRHISLNHTAISNYTASPLTISNNLVNASENNPLTLNWGKNWWIFKGNIYAVSGAYTEEQIKLLIFSEYDKERKLFERLKQKFETGEDEQYYKRTPIPEEVRIQVWRRDGGKCARCGSREKLEYDHIIPVTKGGSNTARNVELLCENCNRKKGANIE